MIKQSLGLVGCGAAAKKYHLPILKMHPEIAKNMFCVDSNLTQAKKYAEELGSSNYVDDYNEIIGKIKGVIVAVPHSLHYPIADAFLRNGVHVLCEKPLTETSDEAHSLVNSAEKNNVNLCVNNTRRMIPSFQLIKELISKFEIGKLSSISYFESEKFNWESETGFYLNPQKTSKGVLLDCGVHVLDLICWLIGSKPELVSYKDDSFGGPESLAYVKAKSNDCVIKVYINRLLDIENRFIIRGEKGCIEGSPKEFRTISLQPDFKTKKVIKSNRKPDQIMATPIIENFIKVVMENEEPLVPGSDVIDSIELIEECYANRTRFDMPWYQDLEGRL